MKKVLLTGSTGFLGSRLLTKFNKLGWEVSESNTKTSNLDKVENLYQYNDIKFDYIFHMAVVTRAGDWPLANPATQWLGNQTINTNILRYWKENQPQAKIICMGTSCSYSPEIHMKEDNYLLGPPEESLYYYVVTKRVLLDGLRSIQNQHGLKWLYFIPSTLYGPDFELDDNHFIFDFVRNCYNAKYNDEKFVVWGNGEQRRELIYIDDAIDAMLNLLHYDNEIFNLGSGQDFTINEFAKEVCKCYDYDSTLIKHDLDKYVGVLKKKIDTEKVLNYLDGEDFIKTDLKYGIQKCVDYFIKRKKEDT